MNVIELQTGLRNLGLDPGPIDGVWGARSVAAARAAQQTYAKWMAVPDERLQVLVEQIMYKIQGGLATGPLDGVHGAITKRASQHWLRGPWRHALQKTLPGDERLPASLEKWPTYAEFTEFYGEPGTGLVRLQLPYPLRLSWELGTKQGTWLVHERTAASLLRVLDNVAQAYTPEQRYKYGIDITGGCYSMRAMRGGTKLSAHSWGVAWDWDPVRNPLRWGKDKARLAGPDYAPFWEAWTNEGWLSLGKARDFDWMHVQAGRL
jgi:hypothetical protein